MGAAEKLRPCTGAGVAENCNDVVPQEWYKTSEAAVYLRTTAAALRRRIARGSIVPDCWGGRGRGREHMFRRATLDAHYAGPA